MASSMTSTTMVATVTALKDVVGPGGNRYQVAYCNLAGSTGTVKTNIQDIFNATDQPAALLAPVVITLTFKTGVGTQPLVGDTFNVVFN